MRLLSHEVLEACVRICFKADAPDTINVQDISCEVSQDNVLIVECGGVTAHEIRLEVPVNAELAKVKWSKAKHTLTFQAPRTDCAALPESKPLENGCANEGSKEADSQPSVSGTANEHQSSIASVSEASTRGSTAQEEGEEDNGLEEMYGAEMFAAVKRKLQEQQQQERPGPRESKPAPTTSSSEADRQGQTAPPACSARPTEQPQQTPSTSSSSPSAPSNQQQKQQPTPQQATPITLHPPTPSKSEPSHPTHSDTQKSDTQKSEMQMSDTHQSDQVPKAQAIDCSSLASSLHSSTAVAAFKSGSKSVSQKKAAKEERRRIAPTLDLISETLGTQGWAVLDNYVPMDSVIQVRKEVKRLEEHYVEGEIWVGKEADAGATIARKDVRGDVVLWLDQPALDATAFIKDGERHSCSFSALKMVMASIDGLVTEQLPGKAPCLANVRERSDAMMAIYPGRGSRFAKHIDNTANDGRRLTLLCYLNPNWKESNGGALRLTPPNGKVVDVYPHAGRVAMFMSKTVAHEVMPAYAPRHSFTLWFYDALERAEAVATAQVAGRGKASAAEQQEARDLIKDMLSRGGEIQATYEGVDALKRRVQRTSHASMAIVASIVGAPSTEVFLDAIENMVPSELERLNEQLSTMGQAHAPSFN